MILNKNNFNPCYFQILIVFVTCLCFYPKATAQVKPLDSIMDLIDRNEIEELRTIVEHYDFKKLNTKQCGQYLIATGGIKFATDDYENAYKDFQKAKKDQKDQHIIYKANELMIMINNNTSELQVAAQSLMEENMAIARELNNPQMLIKGIYNFMFKEIQLNNFDKAMDLSYKMKKIAVDNDLDKELLDIDFNIGTLHYYQQRNDSALFYYEKNLKYVESKNDTFNIATRLNNLAMLQTAIGKEQEAVDNLIKAKDLVKNSNDKELSVSLLRNIADAQVAAGNYEEAIDYYNQFISQEDSLNSTSIAQNIQELQTKYETAEKDLENAELTSKNLTNRNKIYLLLFVLASITAIGIYFFNRMRQKQILLAAQAEAQKQREEKLLRDQELASIDAMITGQEKERKKIAQDLHDDIGSSLTTARMCIENVIEKSAPNESKKILENAYSILNETYSKVRHISHSQKSSVLNSYGLVGTLEQLAQRINAAQSIKVELIHHGLEGRLSNSLELNIFRTIQELLNNIIKHANATHASIILTGYDDHISVIVEDDGTGFSLDKLSSNGTGIHSIKIRVENLDGSMEIDTKINRGTSINIEIPII